jgi:uncharacterized 2Fe-2S/4Fe-4S cluster protein (DUF4445 family)
MSETKLLLALDLGTTTLAGRLLDGSGTILVEGKAPNPQAEVGSDVIRRLEASLAGGSAHLQDLLARGIEALTGDLLAGAGRSPSELSGIAAAGNPAMSYLLRGLPVEEILFPPHRPRHHRGVLLDSKRIGLDPSIPLFLFPLVSGYVGGDLVAFLFSRIPVAPRTFFLDIGTNGEMALHSPSGWHVTSVAAGPAFEGGEISCGMDLRAGAIDSVRLVGDSLRLGVVGEGPPRGLCGSGLVEAVAAGREGGLIDGRGRIVNPEEVPDNLVRYIAELPSGRALRLYRDATVEIFLSQQDIRSFQLAKGAVRAGVECLLRRSGIEAGQIGEVFLTGAFGFSLAPQALKRVAMLPANMLDKVRFIPGGVIEGVSRFLLDSEGTARVERLAGSLKPFPLSGTADFEKAFLENLDF